MRVNEVDADILVKYHGQCVCQILIVDCSSRVMAGSGSTIPQTGLEPVYGQFLISSQTGSKSICLFIEPVPEYQPSRNSRAN